MSQTVRTLRHLPFFEVMGGLEEASEQWRVTKAGLVTLRLYDNWIEAGTNGPRPDPWALHAIRRAIEEIESFNSQRALLTGIVDAIEISKPAHAAAVVPRLMQYARSLHYEGQWALAADVYRTVLEYAQPAGDAEITIAANLQLGFCLRTLAQWQEAMLAYATAGRAASAVGDMVGVLRARVGEGKLAIDRGNLPEAEMILDETIENAVGSGLQSVRAVALHDRAHVAHMRGQFDRAINLGYEALSGTDDPTERDRVLGDLGASFFELGLRDAARDAQLILASTARQQSTRWAATINLLEIAGSDGCEAVFEQYRRELANNPLPAFLAAQYHCHVGEGYRKLKKPEQAREAYRRAAEIAQANELNQILFKAEGSMREIGDGGVVLVSEAKSFEVSSEVKHVADAIKEMRVLACVGA